MSDRKTILVPDDQLTKRFQEACNILYKMRQYRTRFEKNHDAQTKKQMKSWEARADEFLMSLELEDEQELK